MMQKIIKKSIILIPVILVFSCILLYLFLWTFQTVYILALTGGLQGKTTIHKAMNHNQYNIVIVSRASTDKWYFPLLRDMFLEVWLNDKKLKSYYLYNMDEMEEFGKGIKEVTLLPDSNEIKIEFHGNYGINSDGSRNNIGVGLYKIVEDQPDSPEKT